VTCKYQEPTTQSGIAFIIFLNLLIICQATLRFFDRSQLKCTPVRKQGGYLGGISKKENFDNVYTTLFIGVGSNTGWAIT
jgi:hypothetical protein